jgi:hypothetical protein
MRSPLVGGQAATILEDIVPLYWSVTDKGIYFVRQEQQVHSIWLHPFDNQKTVRVGTLPFRLAYFPRGPGRLTASLDGRTAMVSVVDRWDGDLMLLENFR